MFLDTIKYFQESSGTLASNLTDSEKDVIRFECKEFLQKDETCFPKFNSLTQNNLSTGKGTIPYEMIKR